MPKRPPDHLTRRRVLQAALATTATTFALPMLNVGSYRAFGANAPRYSARAMKIVERTLVIDMLAPLKIDFKPEAYAGPISEQAAAEFRASGITAFHNSVGTGGPAAVEETLEFIASWQGYAGRNSHVFSLVGTAADLDRAKKERKIAVIMGVQNAEHFRQAGDVKKFYQLGQRCAQLTYNSQNLIGSGSTDRVDGGVSDFGVEIIKAMNEVGMLVDVSHCGDAHYARCHRAVAQADRDHAFELPRAQRPSAAQDRRGDPQARREGRRDGHHRRAHVRARPGADHDRAHRRPHRSRREAGRNRARRHRLGFGPLRLRRHAARPAASSCKESYKASYGFREKIDIEGFDHPRKMFDLTEALIRRGYSDENIGAILGGNFRRLLGATWT